VARSICRRASTEMFAAMAEAMIPSSRALIPASDCSVARVGPGYWKQFARHGQAFYRPPGTLPSKGGWICCWREESPIRGTGLMQAVNLPTHR
jgi:hypothetical protein